MEHWATASWGGCGAAAAACISRRICSSVIDDCTNTQSSNSISGRSVASDGYSDEDTKEAAAGWLATSRASVAAASSCMVTDASTADMSATLPRGSTRPGSVGQKGLPGSGV